MTTDSNVSLNETGVTAAVSLDAGGEDHPIASSSTSATAEAAEGGKTDATPAPAWDAAALGDIPEEENVEGPGKMFKCIIRNLQVSNSTKLSNPYIKFILGGDRRWVDSGHTGGEPDHWEGKAGKTFSTEVLKNFRDNHRDGKFSSSFVKYWRGEYEALETQFLTITAYESKKCCRKTEIGSAKIRLSDLAQGNIQQTIEIEQHTKQSANQKSRHVVVCDLSFLCYFQEMFEYQLHFYNWKGKDLIAADASGTSDPYLIFKLPRSLKTLFVGGDWGRTSVTHMTKGSYFGRECKSDVQMTTLFPRWEDVGVMKFHGIRSELENIELFVKVYDWDELSADDLIGQCSVPLRGLLDYGYFESGLQLYENKQVTQPNGEVITIKTPKPAGSLAGFIEVEELPAFRQYGEIFELLDGYRYLAVHIDSCNRLLSADANGLTDPFVVIEWHGMKQQTKIIYQNLDPAFDDILYFPIRLVEETAEEFAKHNRVRLTVFDWDGEGNSRDILGMTQFTLSDITASPSVKHGSKDSRTFKHSQMPLFLNGEKTRSTIAFSAWFIDDLPAPCVIPQTVSKQKITDLPPEYLRRETQWKESIPHSILEERDFMIKAVDEEANCRFLPTFLTAMPPPGSLQDPYHALRLVQLFAFERDEEVFGGREDVWASPPFFLNQLQGDQEEHAILLCNIFIGMELDAYVCLGKTRSGLEHSWVMTRNPDGSITFWETAVGKYWRLDSKWVGGDHVIDPDSKSNGFLKLTPEEEESKQQAMLEAQAKAKAALAAAKKKKKKKPIEEAPVTVALFDDDDVLNEEDIAASSNQAQQRVQDGKLKVVLEADSLASTSGGSTSISSLRHQDSPQKFILPYAKLDVCFNNQNLWANVQDYNPELCQFDFENKYQFIPFIGGASAFKPEIKPFFDTSVRLGTALPKGRVSALQKKIEKEIKGAFINYRLEMRLPGGTTFYEKAEDIARQGLEIMENIHLTPISHSVHHVPITEADGASPSTPSDGSSLAKSSSVASTGISATPPSTPEPDIDEGSDSVVLTNLNSEEHASPPGSPKGSTAVLTPTTQKTPYEKLQVELADWKGRMTSALPAGIDFTGVPVSFTYTDHKRIRRHIFEKYEMQLENDPKVQFIVAAYVRPMVHSICAVWVFIGKFVPTGS